MVENKQVTAEASALLERLAAPKIYSSKELFDKWFDQQDFISVLSEQHRNNPDCVAAALEAARQLCWKGWSARDPEYIFTLLERREDLASLIESNRQLLAEASLLMQNNSHLRQQIAEQNKKADALRATLSSICF